MIKKPELKQKANGVYFVELYEGETRRRITTGSRDIKIARIKMRDILTNGASTPSKRPVASTASDITMRKLFDKCEDTIWHERNIRSVATVRSNVRILNGMIGDE